MSLLSGGLGLETQRCIHPKRNINQPIYGHVIRRIKETDGDSFEEMRSLEQELTFSVAEKSFETEMLPLTHLKMQTLGVTNCGRHLLYIWDRNTQNMRAYQNYGWE